MFRMAVIVAALGLTACATAPVGGTVSARDVNCGAGVLGGALIGGVAGNQIGKGQGQDLATAAGATIGGLLGATRPECQPAAYAQGYPPPAYGRYPPAYGPYQQAPVLIGYDLNGRPIYR
jgi:outer membrane lipoprotein SlyB